MCAPLDPVSAAADLVGSDNRRRAEADANVLACMTKKERSQYVAAQCWSRDRARRARGVLGERRSAICMDAQALEEAADKGLDVDAWATEQGWLDTRLNAAKLMLEHPW